MSAAETKWTRGPWLVDGEDEAIREAATGMLIADAEVGPAAHDERRANGFLIVATPDLYEALRVLVDRRERACREHGGSPDGSDGRYARARAALAKARGES
jgi:hypothetical protein